SYGLADMVWDGVKWVLRVARIARRWLVGRWFVGIVGGDGQCWGGGYLFVQLLPRSWGWYALSWLCPGSLCLYASSSCLYGFPSLSCILPSYSGSPCSCTSPL